MKAVLVTVLLAADMWAATTGSQAYLLSENTALVTDSAGNVYVAGHREKGMFTGLGVNKYDARGRLLWSFGASPGCWYANKTRMALGRDPDGKDYCYVSTDIMDHKWSAVYKLNAATGARSATWPDIGDGAGVGARWYRGPGMTRPGGQFYWERPWGLAAEDDGSVFIAAQSADDYPNPGALILRYDATGDLLWEKRELDTGDPVGLVHDRARHVIYVCTRSTVLAYDTNAGSPPDSLWRGEFLPGEGAQISGMALAKDPGGGVYVAGQLNTVTETGTWARIAAVKYAPGGEVTWRSGGYPGGNTGDEIAEGIAVAADSTVVVVSRAWAGAVFSSDRLFAVTAFGPDGAMRWTHSEPALGGGLPWEGVDVDSAHGCFWVAAETPNSDVLTQCRDLGTGLVKSSNTYDGGTMDCAYGLSLDSAGNAIVIGVSGTRDKAALTMSISPTGSARWVQIRKGP